jgi:signal transduction histidine kinase
MSVRDRVDSTLLLLVVSGLLLCVPLVDMWQDITAGKSPVSTVLENSVVLLLSGSFLWLSIWLRRTDWEPVYARLVARWSILGTACVTLAYGWVLGFQVVFQNDLKPYVIAADGVVIAGLVLFVAGVYNARSERESAARTAESERFSALFDNASDAMLAVESGGDEPVVTGVNDTFDRAFGGPTESFVGQPAAEPVAARVGAVTGRDRTTAGDPMERLRAVDDGGDDEQTELRLSTNDGVRDYLVDYVPVGEPAAVREGTDGFYIFTDITPQKQRERQFETLSEGTRGLLEARTVEDVVAAVRTLVVDLFDDVAVGIWRYDRESESFRPLTLAVAETADAGLEGLPAVPAVREDGGPEPTVDGPAPAVDTDALGEVLTERGLTVRETDERHLAGHHTLTVTRVGPTLSTTDRYLVELLAANARAAVRRVEHEEELTRRNDQLEFVNSLLRHDIHNSMTVIRARGRALSDSCDGQDAEYAGTIVEQSDNVIDFVDEFRVLLDALTDVNGGSTAPMDLSSVLEDRIEMARTTYPELTVTADIPDGVEVLANDALGNVFGNAFTNAVEHHDTGDPTVEVSVTKRDGTVVVEVADDGPGIPDEVKQTVFRRGNRGLKESDIGSGFGLFFIDTILEQYGGDVTIADNEPRGTVIRLVFRRPE